jgi:glutamyl-tRNA reductase
VENIYVFGISWRDASSERIQAYTIPQAERSERVAQLRDVLGVPELCYLATCNRVELTCVLAAGQRVDAVREAIFRELCTQPGSHTALRELRVWGGEGAAEHLFLVAAGLDSAQLGEQEVAGQLRRSMDTAREAGTLGPQLLWLYEQVLKVGKRVQTESGLRAGRISLAEIAVDAIRTALRQAPGEVALVGVSKMTVRCAESLRAEKAPLLFINRTLARAEELAERFGGRALSLAAFTAAPPPLRALVSATSAPGVLFSQRELALLCESVEQPPILIDLAVPPDIDPTAAQSLGLHRIDMDEINARAAANSRKRVAENARGRELVDEALDRLRTKVAGRALSPLIGELYAVYRETASRDLERVLGKKVRDLNPEQEEAVRSFAEELARRLAHIPAVGLRALAAEGGIEPVRTFLAASDDPMTERLSELATRTEAPPPEDLEP